MLMGNLLVKRISMQGFIVFDDDDDDDDDDEFNQAMSQWLK